MEDMRSMLNEYVTVDGVTTTVASTGTAVLDHREVPSMLLSDGRRIYGEAVFYIGSEPLTLTLPCLNCGEGEVCFCD